MKRTLKQRIEVLEELSASNLRKEWEKTAKSPAPQVSLELLRLGLAWKMQERAHGGLSREAKRALSASTLPATVGKPRRKLTPGTKLVRDWHGEGHTVTVLEDGFDYADRRWKSLTAIARHITGTHWNGPRFFGLTGKAS